MVLRAARVGMWALILGASLAAQAQRNVIVLPGDGTPEAPPPPPKAEGTAPAVRPMEEICRNVLSVSLQALERSEGRLVARFEFLNTAEKDVGIHGNSTAFAVIDTGDEWSRGKSDVARIYRPEARSKVTWTWDRREGGMGGKTATVRVRLGLRGMADCELVYRKVPITEL